MKRHHQKYKHEGSYTTPIKDRYCIARLTEPRWLEISTAVPWRGLKVALEGDADGVSDPVVSAFGKRKIKTSLSFLPG